MGLDTSIYLLNTFWVSFSQNLKKNALCNKINGLLLRDHNLVREKTDTNQYC